MSYKLVSVQNMINLIYASAACILIWKLDYLVFNYGLNTKQMSKREEKF